MANRSERVASQHHSPWLGTAAVSVRRSEPITWTPPPPPITPTRRQHPGFTATTHTSSLRTPLRRVRTPGEQRCQLVDAVPRSPMTSGLTPGVSQTDLHVPPRVSAQPMHMSPGATRLLHAHPRLDGSSTDHADTAPRSSKAFEAGQPLASHAAGVTSPSDQPRQPACCNQHLYAMETRRQALEVVGASYSWLVLRVLYCKSTCND